jgi:hypothetical protein
VKLKLTHLGRIASAEIEIRPLTVFIGENATNKTWAAYAAYALAHGLSPEDGTRPRWTIWELADDANAAVLADGLTERMQAFAQGTVGRDEFGVPLIPKAGPPFRIELADAGVAAVVAMPASDLPGAGAALVFDDGEWQPRTRIQVHLSRTSTDVQVWWTDKRSIAINLRLPAGASPEEVARAILRRRTIQWPHAAIFPAERKALVVGLSGQDNQLDTFAWAHFRHQTWMAAHFEPHRTPLQKSLGGLAARAGGLRIEVVRAAPGLPVLVERISEHQTIPLAASASIARSIAGLQVWLERVAEPGDVLVVDELEMNAHPRAQLALTELMAAMANAGLRVIFTTHSPYVVDHLSNLMAAARVPAERQAELARRFALGSPECFVAPDKVAAWWFRAAGPEAQVEVEDVVDRKLGLIRWQTFSEVSNELAALYGEILRATPVPERQEETGPGAKTGQGRGRGRR